MNSSRWLLDGGLAGGLALAVLLVIALDKVLPLPEGPGGAPSAGPRSRPMRLAVTLPHVDPMTNKGQPWDDMAKLLRELGDGYPFVEIPVTDLLDSRKIADFDVIFFTCGPGGTRQGVIEPALVENLQQFVAAGGALYASDWRYDCIAKAFPEFTQKHLARPGLDGVYTARVVDPGLRDILGETIPLKFDLDKWKPAAFGGDRVKVLLEGEYDLQFDNSRATAPLLVKFQFDKGTVIFTSFHNEKQHSEVETKLLKYLVFSAVTAQLENQVNQNMKKGGFSPRKSNLLSASSGSQEFAQTYRTQKPGRLSFVLGFDNQGARLKLTVRSPDGQTFDKTGVETLTIDATSPVAGDWTYTVTALSVPYADFPFTVTVGEAKE